MPSRGGTSRTRVLLFLFFSYYPKSYNLLYNTLLSSAYCVCPFFLLFSLFFILFLRHLTAIWLQQPIIGLVVDFSSSNSSSRRFINGTNDLCFYLKKQKKKTKKRRQRRCDGDVLLCLIFFFIIILFLKILIVFCYSSWCCWTKRKINTHNTTSNWFRTIQTL